MRIKGRQHPEAVKEWLYRVAQSCYTDDHVESFERLVRLHLKLYNYQLKEGMALLEDLTFLAEYYKRKYQKAISNGTRD